VTKNFRKYKPTSQFKRTIDLIEGERKRKENEIRRREKLKGE
jgi:hypothetical protein